MFLLQAVQAPTIVRVGEYELEVPKYTLQDVTDFGNRLMSMRADIATEGMDDDARRQHLTMYPPIPPGLGEMKAVVRSLEGATNVIRACVPRSKVYLLAGDNRGEALSDADAKTALPKILESILSGNGAGTLIYLGYDLADLEDKSLPRKAAPSTGKGNGEESPLPGTGNSVSSS